MFSCIIYDEKAGYFPPGYFLKHMLYNHCIDKENLRIETTQPHYRTDVLLYNIFKTEISLDPVHSYGILTFINARQGLLVSMKLKKSFKSFTLKSCTGLCIYH